MEKYCKDQNVIIGTRGCDFSAIDPLGIIFTPKVLPAAIQTLLSTEHYYEAVRTLIYGSISPVLKGSPIVADNTMTPTDNSEGAVVGTYGAGFSQYIRGGNVTIQFDLPQKFCKSKRMMKLNKWNGGCIIITKDYRLVFGNVINGEYLPLPIVTNYVTPKMFDNKTDVTLTSLVINFGELDNVYPNVQVTEQVDELKSIDLEGVLDGAIENVVWSSPALTFEVVDGCTGANITSATYAISAGTPPVPVKELKDAILWNGAALGASDTVTVNDDNIVITFDSAPAAGDYTLEILAGINSAADADDDICYYTAKTIVTI